MGTSKGGFWRPSVEAMSSFWFEGEIETSFTRHFEMRRRMYVVPSRDWSRLQVSVEISSKRQSRTRDGDLPTSNPLVIHACRVLVKVQQQSSIEPTRLHLVVAAHHREKIDVVTPESSCSRCFGWVSTMARYWSWCSLHWAGSARSTACVCQTS
jgi:hypothetical protein